MTPYKYHRIQPVLESTIVQVSWASLIPSPSIPCYILHGKQITLNIVSSLRQFGIVGYPAVACCLVIFNVLLSSSFGHAQPYEKKGIYRVNTNGWIQSEIPGAGDVFTCGKCKYSVYVRIIYGSAPSREYKFQSNEEFLQTLSTGKAQRNFARSVMEDQVPKNTPMDIMKTSISELGGLKVFLFQAVAKVEKGLFRSTTMMAVHRDRMVMVSLNYFQGSLDEPSRNLVRAFLSSFQFL